MTRWQRILLTAAACAALATGPAAAQRDGAQAVRERHANLDALLEAYRGMKDDLAAESPDRAALARDGDRLANLAQRLPSWFPPGSGPESGAETKALPVIWRDPQGFRAKAAGLTTAVDRLNGAVRAGDWPQARAAHRAVSDACNACHSVYEDRF